MSTMTIPRRIKLAALILSFASFAPAPATRAGEVRVVATVPNLGSIASEIAGDFIIPGLPMTAPHRFGTTSQSSSCFG